ncbi:hypothetical protein EMIHUDRAFT_225594 [Emiliania huxleyi CCMP1516]|uniref:Uncharacterized protein n=2 Tax=Emiliania huxleyi TaxID=2903 RepID=A0A0D3KNS9_EMIH1|nr:hypothetical protein EMIHUDRAFT_225594 [Emiliania huxleyi CCMP1516]EOD37414.1 hypothetical protein EMIHUDRAFT_225594 [Emiliania huxleyi CCMP1516]|eukprot:XP_005789843.1 hypothetical protein EMIHUDRAFT_225594 [Emiliania huxleyi CCMP1516]
MADLERACDREAAPKIPAPASEATVTLSLAHEDAVFVLTISADSTVVDFSVPGAGDVAGILRGNGLSTTHLTHFNGGATVDAEVGDKTCPLLWQAADSAETRSWERRLAEAFQPEGMIKLAAAAVDDEETAVRLGRAYGDILGRARAEAEQRGRAEDHGRWTDATLEVISGGLHMFFHRAQVFAGRPDGVGPAFWREFVDAARVRGGEWAPLQLLSETQTSAGARLAAMPWLMWNRRPVAGATSGDTPARPMEEPGAEALSAQAEADLVNHRAAEVRRAAASKWRVRQRETDIWRWQAIWLEMETARARVQQIARIVARGQWRGRYPEVLIVENATQLMDLLYRSGLRFRNSFVFTTRPPRDAAPSCNSCPSRPQGRRHICQCARSAGSRWVPQCERALQLQCSLALATAALRHGGEACLDFKDSASPLLEACGTVQADHTEHPRQLAWPHS